MMRLSTAAAGAPPAARAGFFLFHQFFPPSFLFLNTIKNILILFVLLSAFLLYQYFNFSLGMSDPEQSNVEKLFQSSKLPRELIKGQIPGIGDASIKALKAKKIDTPDKLFAVFFNYNRDIKATIDYLVQVVGIQQKFAEVCVRALERKLGTDVL